MPQPRIAKQLSLANTLALSPNTWHQHVTFLVLISLAGAHHIRHALLVKMSYGFSFSVMFGWLLTQTQTKLIWPA